MDLMNELEIRVVTMMKAHPELRLGQTYMNCLYEISPELYKKATEDFRVDCFYNDKLIDNLKDFLKTGEHYGF